MPNSAHVSIYGKVIAEPKSFMLNNSPALSFPVSVKTTLKKEGSQYYETNIYQCSISGRAVEYNEAALQNGSRVVVHGDLILRPWKDRNGQEKQSLTVYANSVEITSGWKKNDTNQTNQTENEYMDPPF